MTQSANLLLFYNRAKEYCISHGFEPEIQSVRDRHFENIDAEEFLLQYIYVVLNSGMKNQIAEKIYVRFLETLDNNVIRHPGKRKAVENARQKCRNWYGDINYIFWFKPDPEQLIIEYIQNLPYCGKITSYHLARNIGLDVAKPDRHLTSIAAKFEFPDVQNMCQLIAKETNERVGVVDVVLWRFINLSGTAIFHPPISQV